MIWPINRKQNWSYRSMFKQRWDEGNYKWAIFTFLNRFPQWTVFWGKGGDLQYDVEWALRRQVNPRQGCDDFWGPSWRIAWWREVWHFVGGVILGLPMIPVAIFFGGIWGFVGVSPVFLYFVGSEIKDGIKNDGFNLKEVMDIFFWTVGAAVVPTIMILIVGR